MTMAQRADSFLAPAQDMPIDELMSTLRDSGILGAMGVSDEDVQSVSADPVLLERLKVTYELLAGFRYSGVLEAFLLLPASHQAEFMRWISLATDSDVRGKRARTFVIALRESPPTSPGLPATNLSGATD
jgi:hypothetical protein